MPCNEPGHNHQWVTEGTLTIEKCEHYCAYCPGIYGQREWKYAWFLRRHVKTVHCKEGCDYENVKVLDTWTGMPEKKPRLPYRRPFKKDKNGKPKTPSPKKRRMGGKSLPVKQTAMLDNSDLNKLMESTVIDNSVVARPTDTATGFLGRNELDLDGPSGCLTNSEFDFTSPSGFLNNGDYNDDDPSGFLNNKELGSELVTPSGFHNHSDYSTPESGADTSSSGYSTPETDFGTPSKVVNCGQLSVQDVTDPSPKSTRASKQALLATIAREFRGAVAELGQAAKKQGISPAHIQWILTEESEKVTKIEKTSDNDEMDVINEIEVITVEDNAADEVDDADEDEDEEEDEDMSLDDDDDEDGDYQGYM